MQEEKALSKEEQIAQYVQPKRELLDTYKKHKEELKYAADNVEEGLIREKRERLVRQIEVVSFKIDVLSIEENHA